MILIKPLITEKTLKETGLNRYTFIVSPSATKGQIKQAVEETFKVDVVKVATNIIKPTRARSLRTGRYSSKSKLKKAIVQLKPKQTIKYFETK